MSRLADTFARCRREGRAALVTYVMAGNPSPRASRDVALACIAGGADLVELGFPFSDPVADGPTLQRAGARAIAQGMTLPGTLDLAAELRARTEAPVVLMGYVNPILAMGEARFLARCEAAGVDGVIVPDLPADEAASFARHARARGVALVMMLAPTSTPARLAVVREHADGFVYYVSVTGVTGARAGVPRGVAAAVAAVRRRLTVPVVVGFGVSTPTQVRALARSADGVVVGSAIASCIEGAGTNEDLPRAVQRFVARLAVAARGRDEE